MRVALRRSASAASQPAPRAPFAGKPVTPAPAPAMTPTARRCTGSSACTGPATGMVRSGDGPPPTCEAGPGGVVRRLLVEPPQLLVERADVQQQGRALVRAEAPVSIQGQVDGEDGGGRGGAAAVVPTGTAQPHGQQGNRLEPGAGGGCSHHGSFQSAATHRATIRHRCSGSTGRSRGSPPRSPAPPRTVLGGGRGSRPQRPIHLVSIPMSRPRDAGRGVGIDQSRRAPTVGRHRRRQVVACWPCG